MTHDVSNGHVTVDVMVKVKVKVVSHIFLDANISKTFTDRGSVPKNRQ